MVGQIARPVLDVVVFRKPQGTPRNWFVCGFRQLVSQLVWEGFFFQLNPPFFFFFTPRVMTPPRQTPPLDPNGEPRPRPGTLKNNPIEGPQSNRDSGVMGESKRNPGTPSWRCPLGFLGKGSNPSTCFFCSFFLHIYIYSSPVDLKGNRFHWTYLLHSFSLLKMDFFTTEANG